MSITSKAKNKNQNNLIYGAIIAIGLCCTCLTGALGLNYLFPEISTPTQAISSPIPLETVIALTFSAANLQTSIANPSPTPAPTLEVIPTATIFIFQLQTDVAQPTEYIYSTNTPFSLSTATLESIQPTLPPQSVVCSCTGVDYDCNISDFSTHAKAQACFEYCRSQGYGDVHKLDGNDDGLACESLP